MKKFKRINRKIFYRIKKEVLKRVREDGPIENCVGLNILPDGTFEFTAGTCSSDSIGYFNHSCFKRGMTWELFKLHYSIGEEYENI